MSGRSKKDKRSLEIAKKIAKNLIAHRLWYSHTQTDLGKAMGVTFQQYQKLEKCTNRAYAEHLARICKQFDWSIHAIFSDPDKVLNAWMRKEYPESMRASVRPNKFYAIKKKWKRLDEDAEKNYYKICRGDPIPFVIDSIERGN